MQPVIETDTLVTLSEQHEWLEMGASSALPSRTVILKHIQKRPNLVFVRIGANSEFLKWFDPEKARTWDLALSFYKLPNQPISNQIETIAAGGRSKFSSITDIHEQNQNLFKLYDYLLILDDDIVMQHEDVDRLFSYCVQYNLHLAQPSLSKESIGCWRFLKHSDETLLRYTNFVEVMMPVFSQTAFYTCLETFDQSISSWGLDLVWPALLKFPQHGIAVIDAIIAHHVRPFDVNNGAFYNYLRSIGVDVYKEADDIRKKYPGTLNNDELGIVDMVLAPPSAEELNWIPDHTGEYYTSVIQRLHDFLKPNSYFEIGSRSGETLMLAKCNTIAVAPDFQPAQNFQFESRIFCLYQMSADHYFKTQNPSQTLNGRIDFVFLSGLHLAESLLRAFDHAEKHCRENSVIAIHNCLPVDGVMARRSEDAAVALASPGHSGWWTGDAWMAIEALKNFRPDLQIYAFDTTPTGLILITGLNPASSVIRDHYFEIVQNFQMNENLKVRYQNYISSLNIQSTHGIKKTEDLSKYFWI